eukprot:1159286-Pelagomonas_calceolata.AAC.2
MQDVLLQVPDHASARNVPLTAWLLDCRWFLYRADTQARSHDWIVDLSLNVLQPCVALSININLESRTAALLSCLASYFRGYILASVYSFRSS